jgi:hypothetical protein
MKTQLFIISGLIIAFLGGCSKENELKKSVFINDPELTDLPAYSEWGYNTFGAYYDREIFTSNNKAVPVKVVVTNNTMSFILDGQKGSQYSYGDDKDMSIVFNLSGFTPTQYTDLLVLDDSIIDLKNPVNQVKISVDTINYKVDILSGELTFKRAQNLIVDKKQIEVILSGYFEFKALINDKPMTISDGRFDVGISNDNFYNY